MPIRKVRLSTAGAHRKPRPALALHQQCIEERLRGVLLGWRHPERVYAFVTWRTQCRRACALRAAAVVGARTLSDARLRAGWQIFAAFGTVRRVARAMRAWRMVLSCGYAFARWRLCLLQAKRWWGATAVRVHRAHTLQRPAFVRWMHSLAGSQLSLADSRRRATDSAGPARLRAAMLVWRLWARRAAVTATIESTARQQRAASTWRCLLLERQRGERQDLASSTPQLLSAFDPSARRRGLDTLRAWRDAARRCDEAKPFRRRIVGLTRTLLATRALRCWRRMHRRTSAHLALKKVGVLCHRLYVAGRLLAGLRAASATSGTVRAGSFASMSRRRRAFAHLKSAGRACGSGPRRRTVEFTTWAALLPSLHARMQKRCRERHGRRHLSALVLVLESCRGAQRSAKSAASLSVHRSLRLWGKWRNENVRRECTQRHAKIACDVRRAENVVRHWQQWAAARRIDGNIATLAVGAAARRQHHAAFAKWHGSKHAALARPMQGGQREPGMGEWRRQLRVALKMWGCADAPNRARPAHVVIHAAAHSRGAAIKQTLRRWRGVFQFSGATGVQAKMQARRRAFLRWLCVCARSWGNKEFDSIGGDAACRLVVQRSLGLWRLDAALMVAAAAAVEEVRTEVKALWRPHSAALAQA